MRSSMEARSDELLVGDPGVGLVESSDGLYPSKDEMEIDAANNLFPYSIVWGHLPCCTQLLPIVGHMGITDSHGRIHDFQGPYTIIENSFMTGSVYKYCQIDPQKMDLPLLEGQ